MQKEKQKAQEASDLTPGQIDNTQTADNGGKLIFENHILCSQLFRDYVDMKELKSVKPEDIEDVTERYIPMFTEQRDADIVKRVHLPNDKEIFIALIEHKSAVDYNVIMQILRYMVYIWEDYENQCEKLQAGISMTKDYKYPPILPIVYYEGKKKWTSTRRLSARIALNKAFRAYIPDFRYYLISLEDHEKEELIAKKDELSFVMLLNKIKSANEFKNLQLPDGYLDNLLKNSRQDVLNAIARVIAVVLRKQNIPEPEIQDMIDKIKRRQPMGLFDDWEGFDVQEERRIGKNSGKEIKLIELVCAKIQRGWDVSKIADLFEEEVTHIQKIYNIAIKYAPDYDADKIYEELSKQKELVKN